MAVEYWIQIENGPWDLSLHDIDRITGRTTKQVKGSDKAMVRLTSVVAGTPPTWPSSSCAGQAAVSRVEHRDLEPGRVR